MKNFTKAALIITLILVILGSIFCTVGLGIGFRFSEFWDDVEQGEFSIGPIRHIPYIYERNGWGDGSMDWESKDSESFEFSWKEIRELELDVDYGGITIEKSGKDEETIYIFVDYRKENHRRQVKAYTSGKTLYIEEEGASRVRGNDSSRITVQIPETVMEDMWLDSVNIEQNAGYIDINMPLTAKDISINVDAGVCSVNEKLTAKEELCAQVDAGQISLSEIAAESLDLSAGMGQLYVECMEADAVELECGIGQIQVTAAGKESDYSYNIECAVGSVRIGGDEYSGLGSGREIENDGSREMDIECNVGEVSVSFTE